MFFVQYSYPNHVQGKIFGVLVIALVTGAATIPVIDRVKTDFEKGWKIYQDVLIGLTMVFVSLTISSILLAFDKAWLTKLELV